GIATPSEKMERPSISVPPLARNQLRYSWRPMDALSSGTRPVVCAWLGIAVILSFLGYRAAPTRQVIGIHAFCQFKRFLQRNFKMAFHGFAFHVRAKKVGPQEFAEWGRILGNPACTSQFACERAEGVVDELIYRLRQITVRLAAAIHKRMCPI